MHFDHYLIKFKPSKTADVQVVGCLRFPADMTYDQRQEALAIWRAASRPHAPSLSEDEAMYLDWVSVEDGVLPTKDTVRENDALAFGLAASQIRQTGVVQGTLASKLKDIMLVRTLSDKPLKVQ